MSVVIHTYHDKLLHLAYDDAAAEPDRYVIWFEGREHVVTTDRLESPASVWQRVLDHIQQSRTEIHRGHWCGREFSHATVYAGVAPTDEQRKGHIRDHLIHMLLEIASPAITKDSASRVKAALLAAELLGMFPPVGKRVIPVHQMLRAVRNERARRQSKS